MSTIVTIGRAVDNTIVINHPSVSSHHGYIEVRDDNTIIYTDRSTNGTLVNGMKCHNRATPIIYGQNIMLPGGIVLDWNSLSTYMPSARTQFAPFATQFGAQQQMNEYAPQPVPSPQYQPQQQMQQQVVNIYDASSDDDSDSTDWDDNQFADWGLFFMILAIVTFWLPIPGVWIASDGLAILLFICGLFCKPRTPAVIGLLLSIFGPILTIIALIALGIGFVGALLL
ncbi:MAG: FHA domain-containing protein [Muribaculaceae bacterium]|nr:FHA domain-containing protein [Muribaculaceae bacterium]